MSPLLLTKPLEEDIGLIRDDNDDVPVNKKTSFNGRLNQYFHTAKNIATEPPTLKPTNTNNTSVSAQDSTPPISKRKASPAERSLETESDATSISSSSSSPSKRQRTSTRTASMRRALPSATLTPRITRSITRSRSTTSSSSSPISPSQSQTQSTTTTRTRTRTRTPKSQPATPTPTTASTKSLLRDTIPPNLDLLLVGVNPGIMTGVTGHAYAHPSNLFWKLLHWSGITTIRHPPADTYALPGLYNVGNTNIVERPTRDASMLSRAEMDAGVPVLEAKVAAQRPAVVCLVGKSIWEAVWRVRMGRNIRKEEFRYGWQDVGMNMGVSVSSASAGGGEGEQKNGDGDWPGARVFVATTTSGLAAGMSIAEKQAVWNELGEWVKKRRSKRETLLREKQEQSEGEVKAEGEDKPRINNF
ncbi:mismatch-specific DNA-glycosylase [Aspergillus homomorphus CBS 101889]|uniref:DNA glycosylase n=1 Tax=Aspergillus homomorphus (strain CBS 101889) TaxID=1450537 RepID=A0A395HMA7_ASPHC|nr:DNA glycosylase [Aspergillus homomorphus CBS 101889]RAL07404.1 DNA glycosylase [Aspergillus homomorphus CBS 101889]